MANETRRLRRTLGLRAVVLFGLAYMAPMIVYGTFGVLAAKTAGTVPAAYILALVAILLTAYSYGRMAALHPVSGSAYTYTRRSFNAHIGFLVGWAVLLDYFFLPMVIWLIGAAYLAAAMPDMPSWIWVVAFIVLTSSVNIIGIHFADKVNYVLMVVQLLIVAAFVSLCVRYVWLAFGVDSLVSIEPFFKPDVSFSMALAGAAVAAYSFLGFDAVSTLAEETIEPRKTMPRAITLIALVCGGIVIVAAYFAQLVHPSGAFRNEDAAAFEIAKMVGGDIFVTLFLIGLVLTQFTAGLSAQSSTGRLLFAMGRDGVLPRRLFGYLHPVFRTPMLGLMLSGLVGVLAVGLDESTSTSFINFGAFTAFTFVNLSVIAVFVTKRSGQGPGGLLFWVAIPALGALCDVWLLASLDGPALMLGSIWLCLGFLYLLYLTRLFRRPPPEMRMEEAE